MNTNTKVETLTDLAALPWQRGVNDFVLVASLGVLYRHLPPGDAEVDPPHVIAAADGGVWKAMIGGMQGNVISSESPSGQGSYQGQFWQQVVDGTVVAIWVWNGSSWLPVGR